jgi:hypothetical protein
MYCIDCDSDPFCRNGWEIAKHKKGGQLSLDPKKIILYLSKRQKVGGGRVRTLELYEEFKSLPMLNANVLDFLLKNQYLVPAEWKDEYVYFWGTIYRRGSELRVRYLYDCGSCDWNSDSSPISKNCSFDTHRPAAMLVAP